MNEPLRAYLLSDGSSDRMLIPIIEWALRSRNIAFEGVTWINPRLLPLCENSLTARIQNALNFYEDCDLLFIHRDAEKQGTEQRIQEIDNAIAEYSTRLPYVCIVPVRMSEAWFLFDETAIRLVAGKPSGKTPLNLPTWQNWESVPDPKALLENSLRLASDTTGRSRKQLNQEISRLIHLLATRIEDFSPLKKLSAFQHFEADLDRVCAQMKKAIVPEGGTVN